MSMPMTQDGVQPGDGREPAALLAIGPEAKARVRILVVDDEHTLRESCAAVLRHEGYDVTVCSRGQDALELLKRRAFDVLLVDLYMSQIDGLALLRAALGTNHDTIVIVMTGNPSVESSVEALRQGAFDYLPKPFSASHLQVLIGRAVHTLLVAREAREQQDTLDRAQVQTDKLTLLGTAPAFRRAIELARKVAPTDASVFITGESGSGKEMIAQFIHHHSRRSSRPFVAVNCAALPEGLLESEMFGHRKGAFTGAVRDKPGLLEAAHGGTLFLDELAEMPKSIQAKLLRVIQDGVVRRVGSETTDAVVNVRFIAATNGDPEAAVTAGDMREDLYYRLRVVPINVPALRERPEDVPLLADYFLSTYWVRHRSKGAPFPRLTDAALRALCSCAWRGNVRELQNVIEHVAVVVEPGADIRPEDLHLTGDPTPEVTGANPASLISTLLEESYHAARDRVIAQFERQYLTWLVNRATGNMSKAARIAGVDRTTLYRLMERHGLQRSPSTGWVTEREVPAEEPAEALPNGQAGPVTDSQRRQLGLIYSAALSLCATASDVVELARGGNRLTDRQAAPFSIAEMFASVRSMVLPLAEEKRLEVRLVLPVPERRVGHVRAISRVLLNLATNAVKFTDAGEVEIMARPLSATRLEFSVRDTGNGIDPVTLRTLYQPFRKTPSGLRHQFSSSGLGLAICRKLVRAMGSELQVETRLQGATRFFFQLDLPPATTGA